MLCTPKNSIKYCITNTNWIKSTRILDSILYKLSVIFMYLTRTILGKNHNSGERVNVARMRLDFKCEISNGKCSFFLLAYLPPRFPLFIHLSTTKKFTSHGLFMYSYIFLVFRNIEHIHKRHRREKNLWIMAMKECIRGITMPMCTHAHPHNRLFYSMDSSFSLFSFYFFLRFVNSFFLFFFRLII